MSLENLKKYADHCVHNNSARARAKVIGHDDIDGHIVHAREHGFDFSADDMDAMRDELIASGDLTEEQLENAAGGTPTLVVAAAAGAAVEAATAAAAVAGAGVAVGTAATGVTSSTAGSGW